MIVLKDVCENCNRICYAIHFQRNFKNWTSGNNDIDKFIQDTQLSVHTNSEIYKALEWIPYDRFYDIKYIAKGGFGKIYRANWIDGQIYGWDDENENWKRYGQKIVALKSLNNSKNVILEFMNEVFLIYYLTSFEILFFTNVLSYNIILNLDYISSEIKY